MIDEHLPQQQWHFIYTAYTDAVESLFLDYSSTNEIIGLQMDVIITNNNLKTSLSTEKDLNGWSK